MIKKQGDVDEILDKLGKKQASLMIDFIGDDYSRKINRSFNILILIISIVVMIFFALLLF